jgi:DNA-binding response OmpR family regulator
MKKIIIDRTILQDIEGSNTIFKRSSITFFPARSSEEILNLHGVKKADLIVTDASLPLMGGVKLCTLIRSDAELKQVMIIVLCDETKASLSQCREAGANAVMHKPVDYGELLWKVSELLAVPQRKDMRVLLRGSIKGVEGDAPFFAQSHDISISGMQLETDRALKQGDQLTCAFKIGHSDVTVACRVERVATVAPGRHRYGVRFMNCDTKSLVIIDHFVKSGIKR